MASNLPEFTKDLTNLIKNSQRIILFLHLSPDLDSIGSNFGFLNFIINSKSDIKIKILSKDEPSANIFAKIRDLTGDILEIIDPQLFKYEAGDLAIFIDFPEIQRTTNNKEFRLPDFVETAIIDHHVFEIEPQNLNYINTKNLSAASIVYEINSQANIVLKKESFEFILMGILGDSGFLKHRDQKFVQSLAVIQKYCEEFGNENYFKIIDFLESHKPLEEYNLQKIYLNNLIYKENFAYTSMTNNDREAAGVSHTFSETTNGASLIRNIGNSKFVFSVTQDLDDPSLYRASFRSCLGENFQVRDMAVKLGGGGHLLAAGAQFKSENIESAINLVLQTVHELNGF